MTDELFVPLRFTEVPAAEMERRAVAFADEMSRRRTVRHFSDRPVSLDVIRNCIRAASTAPSGANTQPWRFVVVRKPEIKQRIRIAAEQEERAFYRRRAPIEWLAALAPLGTDEHKPFLETAPYLIAVFYERYGRVPGSGGGRYKTYYALESVGIATGILIAALHRAGLATLTHTPAPMKFLGEVLERPQNERPFLLVVAGYPAEDAKVPNLRRKELPEVMTLV